MSKAIKVIYPSTQFCTEQIYKYYPGNWQKIKSNMKNDDFYVTYQGKKFYFKDFLRVEPTKQEKECLKLDESFYVGSVANSAFCAYLLIIDCDNEKAKIVYCHW